jgi:hypothetical protein
MRFSGCSCYKDRDTDIVLECIDLDATVGVQSPGMHLGDMLLERSAEWFCSPFFEFQKELISYMGRIHIDVQVVRCRWIREETVHDGGFYGSSFEHWLHF